MTELLPTGNSRLRIVKVREGFAGKQVTIHLCVSGLAQRGFPIGEAAADSGEQGSGRQIVCVSNQMR